MDGVELMYPIYGMTGNVSCVLFCYFQVTAAIFTVVHLQKSKNHTKISPL